MTPSTLILMAIAAPLVGAILVLLKPRGMIHQKT